MATATPHPLSRLVRHVAAACAADVPDAQLLARFAAGRDEAAFAALVRRHGPMVLATCRRVLRDWHAAQDCFQLTFLLLARKAGTLERPESLGPWLHSVATRTALRARSQAARRRQAEAQVQPAAATEGPEDLVWRDLRPLLDEAVGGLPEPFRVPFVLHYLQGLTVTEVARRLDWPRGTVATRLARARQRLRKGLSARGLTLSAAVLGAALPGSETLACVPASLVRTVIRATATAATKRVPPMAPEQGGGRTMLMVKGKIVAALLLTVAVGGGAVLSQPRARMAPPAERKEGRAPAARTTPEGGRLPFLEGSTLFLLGDYRAAEACFTRLVESHPDSPFAPRAAELAGLARRLGASGAPARVGAVDAGRRLIKAALAGAPARATKPARHSAGTIILPPPRPGSPQALCETPPDDAEVLRALPPVSPGVPYVFEEFRDNIQVVTERIVDRIDPPRFFPLVGRARLHLCRYKCTVYFTEKILSNFPFPFETVRPRVQVVYLDKDYLHLEPTRP
jgi:RNA polymerase sigma factor (sigma-70 family)